MHLIYIDDSRDERFCCFSALAIPSDEWRASFGQLRDFRRSLKRSDGIYVHAEFHAWKLVSGRGNIAAGIVTKWRRCQIFKECLGVIARMPGARLFNAVFPAGDDERAFERMLNRINRTMEACDSRAILICDVGKEGDYTRLTRRMGTYNPIPSQFGTWANGGGMTRNIPIERIIEDPFFKQSDLSYFVQMADLCAYALLRRENPIPSKTKYGIHSAFGLLSPILVREATRRDPEGIIRP